MSEHERLLQHLTQVGPHAFAIYHWIELSGQTSPEEIAASLGEISPRIVERAMRRLMKYDFHPAKVETEPEPLNAGPYLVSPPPPIAAFVNKGKRKAVKPDCLFAEGVEPLPGDSVSDVSQVEWKLIVSEIDSQYKQANQIRCPWTPLAFKRLKAEIKARDRWTTDEFIRCIRNRYLSDDANVGEAPEYFIPRLVNYISAPLDKYHIPKKQEAFSDEGTLNPAAARTRRAAERVIENFRREAEEAGANHEMDHGDSGSHGDRAH